MSGLSVEDFKNLLLELYLAQRENAQLRAETAALRDERSAPEGREDEGV